MHNQIKTTLEALRAKQTVLYPTDTVWGLGCDATDEKAVAKIYEIKERAESKSMIVLVNSIDMLNTYIKNIPTKVLELLLSTEKPTTIIYKNPTGLAKNVIASDNTVAVRLVKDEFCEQLIADFGKAIVSTSANISGEPTAMSYHEISPLILDAVDYVVDLHHEKKTAKSSTILKLEDNGEIKVLRP